MIPRDDGGDEAVDEAELQAPQSARGGREVLQTLGEELALEFQVLHLVPQQLVGDLFHRRIGAAKVEKTKVHLGDQFGGEEDLDVELEVHEVSRPAEDGVRPLLVKLRLLQVGDEAGEQGGVALLLGHEEINGSLIAGKLRQRGDDTGVALQSRAAAAFTELKNGE